MSQHVIALDQGTTSSRAIIFDVNGKVVSLSQHPFAQIYPQPGWVEHDPMTILYTQLESLSEAFRTSGLSAADIAAGLWLLGQALLLEGLVPPPEAEKQP